MSDQYNFSVPPPSYGNQSEYNKSSYGNNQSDRESGGGRGGFGGNYGGDRGGYSNNNSGISNKGGFKGDMVTQEDTIFVCGMNPETTENEIFTHFGSIGIIKKDKRTQKPKIWIYKNKETGVGKGEATVTYDDSIAAQSAISWFDGGEFNGAKIKVSLAQRNNTWQNKGGKKFGNSGGGSVGSGGRGGYGSNEDRGDNSRGGRSDDRGSRGGYGGAGRGEASTGSIQQREGDWICSDCSNKNFAWRNECNRCKTPKGDGDGGGSGGDSRGPQRGGGGYRDRDGGSRGGSFGRGGGNRGGAMRNDRGGGRQRPY